MKAALLDLLHRLADMALPRPADTADNEQAAANYARVYISEIAFLIIANFRKPC